MSYPPETVLSNNITRNRIVLSLKDSPRKRLGRRPNVSPGARFPRLISERAISAFRPPPPQCASTARARSLARSLGPFFPRCRMYCSLRTCCGKGRGSGGTGGRGGKVSRFLRRHNGQYILEFSSYFHCISVRLRYFSFSILRLRLFLCRTVQGGPSGRGHSTEFCETAGLKSCHPASWPPRPVHVT